jgi:hypothetical protein
MRAVLKLHDRIVFEIEREFIDQAYLDQTYTQAEEIDGVVVRTSLIYVDGEKVLPVIGENVELVD